MVFWRKKIDKPKSVLGYALYRYDEIFEKNLKGLFNKLLKSKRINFKNINNIVTNIFSAFDDILDDISVDNFKTDYKSDKIRYLIINLINKIKDNLEKLKKNNFTTDNIANKNINETFNELLQNRDDIKKKMKDIQSDYF